MATIMVNGHEQPEDTVAFTVEGLGKVALGATQLDYPVGGGRGSVVIPLTSEVKLEETAFIVEVRTAPLAGAAIRRQMTRLTGENGRSEAVDNGLVRVPMLFNPA